jgi:arginase family enzyme
MTPLDALALMLRPAGGGVYVVSTGKAELERLQRRLYQADSLAQVEERWKAALAAIPTARGVLLGIPSDIGAGYRRGANLGPGALRQTLLDTVPDWPLQAQALGLVDLGDVFVCPQLLHDSMHSPGQLAATRAALYPALSAQEAATLPASPLSIAERVWSIVFGLNPKVKPFVLGGDHSTALPGALALAALHTDLGIVQPDAHTDLLETRLGVRYCFATWSYHANEAIGRGGRLVQVGIRATGRTQEHWESALGVRQFWAKDIRADAHGALDALISHLRARGVGRVYFSNDIDGTDSRWADATGTPEPDGLEPDWVVELIRRLGRDIGLVGGDVMEVAPPLGGTPESAPRTLGLAVRYLRETIAAALGNGP